MTGSTSNKVFDDYEVNCNECEHYWCSDCDGVPINEKRNCASFKATRTVDIPKQIAQLKQEVVLHRKFILGMVVGFIIETVLLLHGVKL